MFNFYLYDLTEFNVFENLFQSFVNFSLKNVVFLCIGTKNYANDSFGVLCGDKLKNKNVYCYGSSVREINGTNFLDVYNFVKSKHKNAKIVVIDSVFVQSTQKPILIFRGGGVNVSGLNSNALIGDAGILFNSFSYHNNEKTQQVLCKIEKMINSLC